MILTYKIQHERDFSEELKKAKQVAEFVIKTKSRSSKDVKHIGLKSVIANQILKKYANKKYKKVRSVKLTIPSQSIKVDKEKQIITIPCIKASFQYFFPNKFTKINQIEVGEKNYYVSCTVQEEKEIKPESHIGVDLNTVGHCAVVGNPKTGKVLKLGKKQKHIHNKYKNIRKQLQKKAKYKKVKQIKNRESRIVRDLNHKISRKIVNYAKENKCGIKLENLEGIRKNKKHNKTFKYALNSWSFYQLRTMIEYKSKILGIPVVMIAPQYTSQTCSKCGLLGKRTNKKFNCDSCGHVEHADVNASFNIALKSNSTVQLHKESVLCKGSTDTPKEAPYRKNTTSEPHEL